MATETIRIQVRPDPTTVIITGDSSTYRNIGVGAEVYKNEDPFASFRRISGSGNTTVSQVGDTIIVNSSGETGFVLEDTFTGYTATTEVRLEGIEADITGNTAAITANTAAIVSNDADIAYLSGQTSGNTQGIADNLTLININAGKIQTNTDNIADNATGITQNLNNINSNTSRIANNENDINALQTGVTANTQAINTKVSLSGDTMTGALSVPELILQTGATVTGHTTGSMHWNPTDGTIDLHLLKDVTLQAGQENVVFGEAIETLTDGDLVQSYGFKTDGTILIGKTDPVLFGADYYTGNDVAVMTSSAVSGETCYATVYGRVRNVNVTYSAGTTMFMSNTVRGLLTGIEPVYPETRIPVGFAALSGASGELIVNPALDLSSSVEALDLQTPFFTGTFVDKVSQTVTSSGGTVTLNIEKDGGGDFRVLWGTEDIVTYPPTGVTLTTGTASVPVLNWVSMTKTSIQAQTGWFTGNQLDTDGLFAPVGTVLCQSAADVALDGVYKHHGWIDKLDAGTGRGDNSKTAERERQIEANWDNGVLPTIVVGTEGARIDRIDYSSTIGVVYQKSRNVMPVRTTIGDLINIHIVNSTTSPYYEVTDLGLIDESYDGVAIANNNRVNIVVWGVVSQNQSDCKIFANAWLGTYASDLACENDSSNYADYNIPKEYQGTGFLIARIALKYTSTNNGTWEILNSGNYYDLRGKIPNTSAGGAGGGTGTISVKNSIEQDVDLSYQLVNDLTGATSQKYYGFDSGGTRGYHDFTTGSESFSGLTDTEFSGVTDLDVVVYSSGTSKWENQQPTDVFENVSDGEYLLRSGTTIVGSTGTTGTVTGATNGLQKIGSGIGLGGTLTETTTIINGNSKNLSIGASGSRGTTKNEFWTTNLWDTSSLHVIRGTSGAFIQLDAQQKGSINIKSQNGTIQTEGNFGTSVGFEMDWGAQNFSIHDNRTGSTRGIQYAADYSADYDARTLVDKDYSDTLRIVSLSANTTLDSSYNGKMIEATGTITITVPSGMTEGWNVSVSNIGSGVITFAAQAGATIQSKGSAVTIADQWAGAVLFQSTTAHQVIITGDLT